jgi:O-antigen ligase
MATTTLTSREPAVGGSRPFVLATLLVVAWGALAFGSPYPWAYAPLAAASALLGAALLWSDRRSTRRSAAGPVLIALGVVAAGAAVQLAPLPPGLRETISPSSTALLDAVDLRFAAERLQPDAPPLLHPLTISTPATATALGLLLAFSLLLWGLTGRLSRAGVESLARSLVGLGLLVAVIGIVQKAVLGDHAFGGMRIYGFWEPTYKVTTPFGPFVNKNHFAGWMLMAIPLALGYVFGVAEVGMRHVRHGWRNRLLWLSSPHGGRLQLVCFVTLVMTVALLMTKSRSGIGCFVVAMALAAVPAIRQQREWKGRLVVVGALAALAVVALSWSRVDVVARFSSAGPNDASLALRRAAWHDTLAISRDFPLVGTGLNTFGLAMTKYQTALTDMRFKEAHNDYLQILAEGGLLLGVPALAAMGLFGRGVWKRFRERRDDRLSYWIRFGATTGVVAIALQSLVEFSLQMPGNAVFFVVLCAMALHRAPVHSDGPTRAR